MSENRPTGILVAGMHRSGTSALTGTLGKLGVSLGAHMLEPGVDNPKGYWENRKAVHIHERLLTGLDRRWDDVRPLPDNWLDSEPAKIAAGDILDLISDDFSGSPIWAVKDPRMCRLLPLWIQCVRKLEMRPVVLFMARTPSEVAASILARNHWDKPLGVMLWLRYMVEAEEASRLLPRAAVTYDDLLSDPISAVTDALGRLDVALPSPSVDQSVELSRFVDGADRHHVHLAVPGDIEPIMDALARKAYLLLVQSAHGEDKWSEFRLCLASFEKEWESYGSCIDAVAAMAHRLSVEESAARADLYRLESELNGQMQWARKMVEDHASLQEDHASLQEEIKHLRHLERKLREELDANAHSFGQQLEVMSHQLGEAAHSAQCANDTIQLMRQSLSWRMTKFLRDAAQMVRRKDCGDHRD